MAGRTRPEGHRQACCAQGGRPSRADSDCGAHLAKLRAFRSRQHLQEPCRGRRGEGLSASRPEGCGRSRPPTATWEDQRNTRCSLCGSWARGSPRDAASPRLSGKPCPGGTGQRSCGPADAWWTWKGGAAASGAAHLHHLGRAHASAGVPAGGGPWQGSRLGPLAAGRGRLLRPDGRCRVEPLRSGRVAGRTKRHGKPKAGWREQSSAGWGGVAPAERCSSGSNSRPLERRAEHSCKRQ